MACARRYGTDPPEPFSMEQREVWISEQKYPVLCIAGTEAFSENADWIIREYMQIRHPHRIALATTQISSTILWG